MMKTTHPLFTALTVAHGIIHGVGSAHFEPARNIRRDEMAQIVFKAVTSP